MKRTGLLVALGAMTALTAPVAVPAAVVATVQPFAARAPESAFSATSASDNGVAACKRPAPDGRVSTTIHCYRPDDLRSFYGLGPLTTSNEGAGQTIVAVDAYGSPTAATDLAFFAQAFHGPPPSFETAFPLGSPDYTHATGNGTGQSGPNAADSWAGEANLDVQWAYAMAPKAHIVLLATPPAETQGVQGLPNLMKAIDWAIAKYPSGTVFSMSFGTDEQAFGSKAGPGTRHRTNRSWTPVPATRCTGDGRPAVGLKRSGTRAGPASGPAVACPRSTVAPPTRIPCPRSSAACAVSLTSPGTRPPTEAFSSTTPTSRR